MDKTIKPLKIYICYGHEIGVQDESGNELYPEPNNESVVLKIKKYLENQGHDVWIDKEKIRRGDDWHGRLIEIIKMADVVLFCITHNAMRPNGSWKDEIAITMGACGSNMISVNLETVHDFGCPTYPLNINLFTEFQDWRLHWTAESIDEAWFGKTLKSLAVSFEKVAQCSFDMRELKKLLKPWDMSYRLRRLDRGIQYLFNENTQDWERKIVRKFCGRKSIFNLFEDKIIQGAQAVLTESDRVLWFKKGPGFGKSRFALELYYRYTYVFSAAYFIEYD